jgi:hypothetical protein
VYFHFAAVIHFSVVNRVTVNGLIDRDSIPRKMRDASLREQCPVQLQGPTQPPKKRVKQEEREADHSPQPSGEIKNAWQSLSTETTFPSTPSTPYIILPSTDLFPYLPVHPPNYLRTLSTHSPTYSHAFPFIHP